MIQPVDVRPASLSRYSAYAHLVPAVLALEEDAAKLLPALQGRKLWMINSTAQGGGVAEMLPMMVALLRELGLSTEWVVIGSDKPEFFHFTKRLHNLIHGAGEPEISPSERAVYEEVNRRNAAEFESWLGPRDLVVVHDPQPMPMISYLEQAKDICAIWRCHIGLDERVPATRAAWNFLEPYAAPYERVVFSAPDYIPRYLAEKASIIHPALDPLSHKNRSLNVHKFAGILCNSGLIPEYEPVLTPRFAHSARRLHPSGVFVPADAGGDIGIVFRPTVTQISRWDHLKGFAPLLEAFARLKSGRVRRPKESGRHRRRLKLARLVLAGPDPESVQDDPEAVEVLRQLSDHYRALSPELQRDVVLLSLPMASLKENALMVNTLQLSSTVLVQNSIREGFGLTATEGMWKAHPVLVSNACGLRQQVRDGVDGRINPAPEDPDVLATLLDEMLSNANQRTEWGRNAQRRVLEEFLIFTQLRRWLRVLADAVERPRATAMQSR